VKEVDRLKEEGNKAFKLGKLEEALNLYTNALEVRSRCTTLAFPDESHSFPFSGLARTRTKEREASCAHCCCPTVPLPLSKYVTASLLSAG
jgi:hypothetical protein